MIERNLNPALVGSGTLNDLTKLAAYRSGRQYLCVSTAASVDGYTAFGAAITRNGFKQTMSCPAPRAVVADLDVLVMAQLRESYTLAHTIRSRYSMLDLVNEVGILDACVDELFAPGGYWPAIAHP